MYCFLGVLDEFTFTLHYQVIWVILLVYLTVEFLSQEEENKKSRVEI